MRRQRRLGSDLGLAKVVRQVRHSAILIYSSPSLLFPLLSPPPFSPKNGEKAYQAYRPEEGFLPQNGGAEVRIRAESGVLVAPGAKRAQRTEVAG